MSTEVPRKEEGLVITEEDLEKMDHQEVLDEPLAATDKYNEVFLKIGIGIAFVASMIMLIFQLVAVGTRYFMNSSIAIASEGPIYFFPWLICGGAIIAQAQMGHVAVNYVLTKMKNETRRKFMIGIWIVVTIILAYVTYLAIYLVRPMTEQTTLIMGWPQIYSFLGFVVMAAVMTIQAAIRVYVLFNTDPANLPITEEKDGIPTEEEVLNA